MSSIETINKINSLGLGFDQLDDDLTEVDLDLSKVAELDFDQLETALASLEEIDMEEVTQEIEERIAESIEIIEVGEGGGRDARSTFIVKSIKSKAKKGKTKRNSFRYFIRKAAKKKDDSIA